MDQEAKQIILDHLYEEHYCNNCKHQLICKLNPMQSVCEKWEENPAFGPDSLLKIVRMAYPSLINGGLMKEFAMEAPSDNIFYIKPVYASEMVKEEKEISMDIREDEHKPVTDLLSKWSELVKDVQDGKKDMLAQLLENQEAYLNSMNMGKK